ncbi:MAG: hypothetical protein JRJ71_12835 [Deltaproteobacteria bacterium]|nr:hypothetical protein [Deltaproteobacteria bacterium]
MKKMNFRSIFHRGLGYSAPLRVIVPVALTFVLFLLSVFLIFIPSMEERMTFWTCTQPGRETVNSPLKMLRQGPLI